MNIEPVDGTLPVVTCTNNTGYGKRHRVWIFRTVAEAVAFADELRSLPNLDDIRVDFAPLRGAQS